MVGVVVGDHHLADAVDFRREQLLAQVWAAIDQQPLAIAVDQDRGAQAAVARLSRVAGAPPLPSRGTPVDVPQPRIRIFTRRLSRTM